MQVVYNANKLAKLVKKKKKMQNWLVYYKNKYSRNNSERPFMKVLHCNLIPLISIQIYYFFFKPQLVHAFCLPDWFSWALGK
jgi:hypothetical protein